MAATKSKTKTTKAASKAPAKGRAAATKKKASEKQAAKPKPPKELLEAETFAKFIGYRTEVDDDERVFEPDELVYIVAVEEEDEQVTYDAIKVDDISEWEANGDDNVTGGQVAPQEVTGLKGTALDKAREAYVPVKIVGQLEDLLDDADGDAIAVADQLFERVQESYFYMGGALAKVLQDASYMKENGGDFDGEDAFNDFCQEHFAFKASKGRALARIYTTLAQIEDFDPEKLAGIGWSLVNKAEKYITADNVDEVLETVRGESQRTVDTALQTKFANDGKSAAGRATSRGGSIQKRTLSFRLEEAGGETVELALKACMKQAGFQEGQEALALERICTEWAQDHVEAKTAKQRIASKAKAAAKNREKQSEAKAAPAKKPASGGGRKKAA